MNIEYSFETVLFGLDVDVEADIDTGEKPSRDSPGYEPEYVITKITHKGEDFEVDDLPDETLAKLSEEAQELYNDDYDPY